MCVPACVCVWFAQNSDAPADDVEVPVENNSFMDDFFAQVYGLIYKQRTRGVWG